MVPDIGNDTADHSHDPIHAMTEIAVLEGTPHTLHPTTTATHAALQLMYALGTPHAIATNHPALVTFPAGTTHATPWTRASLTPVSPVSQHNDTNSGKSSNAQDPQPPINSTTPKLPPSRILIQTPQQILPVTLIL